jgi:cob(I)alamin adenosyltransferase
MVRLNRITTRTGDGGTTGLGDGSRLPKHHPLIAAIGAVDEINSLLGVVRLEQLPTAIAAALPCIQNDLFDVGSDLACPRCTAHENKVPRVSPQQVIYLEALLLEANSGLAPLTTFVLPSGTRASAHLHLARAVTRRAEREVSAAISAMTQRRFNPDLIRYLNRLSDLLFVWARWTNAGEETLWVPGRGALREPYLG